MYIVCVCSSSVMPPSSAKYDDSPVTRSGNANEDHMPKNNKKILYSKSYLYINNIYDTDNETVYTYTDIYIYIIY